MSFSKCDRQHWIHISKSRLRKLELPAWPDPLTSPTSLRDKWRILMCLLSVMFECKAGEKYNKTKYISDVTNTHDVGVLMSIRLLGSAVWFS